MKKIIAFLLIFSPNQVVAFDYTCVAKTANCGSKDPFNDTNIFDNCSSKTSEQQYLNGNVCSGDRLCADVEKMYDNCFLDKMRGRGKIEFGAVTRTCKRIACHPTLIQKFKYR